MKTRMAYTLRGSTSHAIDPVPQSLDLLRGRTSYHNISWSLDVPRFRFRLSNPSKIWQASRQLRFRDACQFS